MTLRIRPATPSESGLLSQLARRAKAHWGYPEVQLELWRTDLVVTCESIGNGHTFVAERGGGGIAGFYQLDLEATPPEFAHLWVEPSWMGRGTGRALVEHALARLAWLGFGEAAVDSDPHAAGFYEALGARRVGGVPAPIEGDPARVRPQLRIDTRAGRLADTVGRSVRAARRRFR